MPKTLDKIPNYLNKFYLLHGFKVRQLTFREIFRQLQKCFWLKSERLDIFYLDKKSEQIFFLFLLNGINDSNIFLNLKSEENYNIGFNIHIF